MAKRTDYSKVSHKAKLPKSIRYNVQDFEAAVSLSGRSTVQGLWDYLLAKYLADMGVRIKPIDKLDTRPIDPRVFDVSKERAFVKEITSDKEIDEMMKAAMKTPKQWHESVQMEISEIAKMPMWKPNPKVIKVETKAETKKFAVDEMKRLKEMQERAEKLKGKKK